jgi:3-oxoacyl-[acyl-carrier protein] reductase
MTTGALQGPQPEFSGKVAIVTGASRRMGKAIALRLSDTGASVVVNAKTSAASAAEVVRAIETRGGKAISALADVTDPDAVRGMVDKALEAFGRIDILVNTVAIRHHDPLAETTLASWHEVLASVLDSTFLCAQACAPHLTASKGAIVNIGGASAHFGQKHHAAVMTAKMGLVGLTRALALDLGPEVVVNCLIPGRIEAPEDRRSATPRYPMERIPAGRAGSLEEVAEAVIMLCNPRSRFINAQAIHISGGMLFGL